jgi:hypothetical protein
MRGVSEKRIYVLVLALVCLLIVACALALLASRMHRASVEGKAEGYMVDAYSAYDRGAMGETTNAFCRYINYLDNHRQELTGRVKVDLMLYVAHSKLSYFFLAHHDLSNAQIHLRCAYNSYRATGLPHKETNEFLDYVIQGTEALAKQEDISWNPHGALWTNTLFEMRSVGF